MRGIPTPEKKAEQELKALRLELFYAEQRLLEAQMHAAFSRTRLAFFQEVMDAGIEHVASQRNVQWESPRAGHTLTEVTPDAKKVGRTP